MQPACQECGLSLHLAWIDPCKMRGKINTTLQKKPGGSRSKNAFETFFSCLSRTTDFVILCISPKLGAPTRQAEEQAFSSRVPTDKARVYLFEKNLLFNWHLYIC